MRIALAGFCYFAIVFAAGFLLGPVRIYLVAPRIGELAAVAAELPIMLAVSWFACVWVVRGFAVAPLLSLRLAMGAIAFTLLMAAEFALATFAFGNTVSDFIASLRSPPGMLGLAGQVLFALFPLLHAFVRRRTRGD